MCWMKNKDMYEDKDKEIEMISPSDSINWESKLLTRLVLCVWWIAAADEDNIYVGV